MIAVYTVIRGGRCDLTSKSLKMLRTWAGCKFDHFVAANDVDPKTLAMLKDKEAKGYFKLIQYHSKNYGQNIAANWLLDEMGDEYDWVLRWDDDAIPRTRKFLKKLVAGAQHSFELGFKANFAPVITKLKNPPLSDHAPGDDLGFNYEPVGILGGICRLHHGDIFKAFRGEGWRFNRFGALGFGEANEMADHIKDIGYLNIRNLDLKVEHAYGEDGQAARWPDLFSWEAREVGRTLGYGL